MRKKIFNFTMQAVLLFSLMSCNNTAKQPQSDNEKTLYTIGHMFGGRLKNLSLSSEEVEMVIVGIRDSIMAKKPLVPIEEYQGKMSVFFRERMAKASEVEKKSGETYLNDFIQKESAMKTASGLAYKILKPGSEKKPKETDTVKVHYHGTLRDGKVFDSSVENGKEVSFPLNRVIKGWIEGLQLIGEGGSIKLVIPSDLAYGDHGAPPKIPGGATLTFKVDLIKVVDAPEAPKKEIPEIKNPKMKNAPKAKK